jgi:thiol-disulfide isomerase/thioredoxin
MIKTILTALCMSVLAVGCGTGVNADPVQETNSTPAPKAPEFKGINRWINSEPLTMAQLRGKVVLVEFWTYSCINCVNVLPHVKQWHQQYKDQGLVVVGVHTPEYGFEKIEGNVRAAVKRFGIEYAVAQDNGFETWEAYNNRYWPALYLIDRDGRVVYQHFGEGDYAETEARIRQLLAAR